MASIVFRLAIGAEDWLDYYRRSSCDVVVWAENGRRLRFPARVLHRFVGHDGVRGRFRIDYDEAGRFQAIERLEASG